MYFIPIFTIALAWRTYSFLFIFLFFLRMLYFSQIRSNYGFMPLSQHPSCPPPLRNRPPPPGPSGPSDPGDDRIPTHSTSRGNDASPTRFPARTPGPLLFRPTGWMGEEVGGERRRINESMSSQPPTHSLPPSLASSPPDPGAPPLISSPARRRAGLLVI